MTLKLFEMFSGYGGSSFGLKKAGINFECIGFSEINKFAIQCYIQNHGNIKNFGDCSKIDTKDLSDFDLLTGGFPCQDVSMAGSRDLSKGRTNLYLEIIRIAKAKQPKYMLLENVKGLLSIESEDRLLINKIVQDLRNIGYDVCWKVLNSKDFGIPQNRERIWFVCKLGVWEFMEFMFPEPKELILFVKDILEKEIDKKYYLSDKQVNNILNRERFEDHLFENEIPLVSPTLCAIGQSDVSIIDVRRYKDEAEKRVYKKVVPILMAQANTSEVPVINISPTLTTELAHQWGRVFSPEKFKELTGEYRRLTPKECFRLMGFLNDEINIKNISDSQLYRLAGNGWDINVASKIFKNLFKTKEMR